MPKKPRKIHIGGRLWSDQKTRDAAAWAAQKAASEPKPKTAEEKREEAEARRRAAEARWRSEERQRQQAEEGARRRAAREAAGGAAGGSSGGSGGQGGQERQERQTKAPVRPGRLAHLRVLGLTAAQDNAASISKAYRTLAMKYHPDRNDSAAALAMMKLVNNANDFLTKD